MYIPTEAKYKMINDKNTCRWNSVQRSTLLTWPGSLRCWFISRSLWSCALCCVHFYIYSTVYCMMFLWFCPPLYELPADISIRIDSEWTHRDTVEKSSYDWFLHLEFWWQHWSRNEHIFFFFFSFFISNQWTVHCHWSDDLWSVQLSVEATGVHLRFW